MSTIEQQIWQLVQQLDNQAKLRLVERIEADIHLPFDFDQWLERTQQLRQALSSQLTMGTPFSVQDILDEIREEASWRGLS